MGKRRKSPETAGQNIFYFYFIQESATEVSYMLSHKLVKQSEPFSDGECLTDCMVQAVSILHPDNKGQFQNVTIRYTKTAQCVALHFLYLRSTDIL